MSGEHFPEIPESALAVRPSPRQLAWQRMEFYGFAHFGVNTFTNREWGLGDEDPAIFNPTEFDGRQWVRACKSAGMTGLILTCKHHDGFCLWPSRYTEHSVKNSPWRGGRGDMVAEVASACREGGLRFGVYLSPWDRHEPTYGHGEAYNRYYLNQLEELLTGYGDVFCVWLDGACGEGNNGKRQVYDWDAWFALIRRLQPGAVISICGPDVRWCGNEAGRCRPSEWSVVPASLRDAERTAEKSQKADDGAFSRRVDTTDDDLGSREAIAGAGELAWYPAEVDTSIRPGWFHHPEEDGRVRSCEELLHIYENAVGGNAALLLNIPPDRRGLFHEADVAVLAELGDRIRAIYGSDLAAGATHGQKPEELLLPQPVVIDTVMLMENIEQGQRVEAFTLEALVEGAWQQVFTGTVIGYKKICRFGPVRAEGLRLTVTQARACPQIVRMSAHRHAE